MSHNFMQVSRECPNCHQHALFTYTKVMKIDGKTVGPLSEKCDECGYDMSDEDVIKAWKDIHRE